VNVRQLYDKMRMGHAMLHRAYRVASAIRGYTWPAANTASLNVLRGTQANPAYWDQSSGVELLSTDIRNSAFQIIKNTQNRIMRRLDLLTNNSLTGEEFCMVMGPKVAEAIAESGEIVNYLKQQVGAKADLMMRNKKWGIPDEYNGWKLVVEDVPRVFIRQKADGTLADVTVAGQKDYVWNDDAVFFGSRVGGLDGQYGYQNFSTVQCYTFNGEARVFAYSDPQNELINGRIDTEDDIQIAAPISGFYLTGVLSTIPQP
jgi:hypothetical protein